MNENMKQDDGMWQVPTNEMLQTERVEEEKKKSFQKGIFIGMATALLLMIAVFAVMFFARRIRLMNQLVSNSANTANANTKETIVEDEVEKKMQVLQDAIDTYFWEDVDTEQLEEGVYRGILDSLDDPYSVYYTAEELQKLQEDTEGIYYGVGAYVGMNFDVGYAQLSQIIENTPAEATGLLAGDYIVKVDGEDMQGKELSYVVSKLKGEEGSYVTITILREGMSDMFDVDVERKKIESPTVNYEMYDNQVAYIQITEFDTVTEKQFADAYQEAKAADMKGLIIDLRSNGGGNLSTVVEIARQILPKGLIVYTEDKYGERVEYSCDGKNEIQVPVVVLVNGYSASASEILAGAIKDYGIGTLVGTTTYGKGIVQKVIFLSDGSAVKLTVSNYFTPNGNNIHQVGIVPDVEVELDTEQYLEKDIDNQLNKAKEVINSMIQ